MQMDVHPSTSSPALHNCPTTPCLNPSFPPTCRIVWWGGLRRPRCTTFLKPVYFCLFFTRKRHLSIYQLTQVWHAEAKDAGMWDGEGFRGWGRFVGGLGLSINVLKSDEVNWLCIFIFVNTYTHKCLCTKSLWYTIFGKRKKIYSTFFRNCVRFRWGFLISYELQYYHWYCDSSVSVLLPPLTCHSSNWARTRAQMGCERSPKVRGEKWHLSTLCTWLLSPVQNSPGLAFFLLLLPTI